MTERGLKNYNKRKDYGEIDSQTRIAKDDTVLHFKDEDRIWWVKINCEIEKRINRKTKKGTRIEVTKRFYEFETSISEKYDEVYLIKRASRLAEVTEKETLKIKEIKRIKPIGLVQ